MENNLDFIVEKISNQVKDGDKLKDFLSYVFGNVKNNFNLSDFSADTELLLELGSFLSSCDKDLEAEKIFELISDYDAKNLLALQNLHNLRSKVARWHFRMLNDETRNCAFKKAIQYWIENGKENIMDIGCGTGLLSLYAAGVKNFKKIYAIEADTIMHSIASQVISENGKEEISLIHKYSTDLSIPEDIPKPVDLIMSEILDSGVFGEGILETLIHAKTTLLTDDGKIVPYKVKIFVAGFNSAQLSSNHIILNNSFYDYIFTDKLRFIAEKDEPYDAEYTKMISDFKIITETCEALEVNFNSLESMVDHYNGTIISNIQLECTSDNDFLDGFVIWFELYLNEDDLDNFISTEPKKESCWQQAIFPLKERVLVEKYQIIKLSVSCKHGILKVEHYLDVDSNKFDTPIDSFVVKFLNDEKYLENLEDATNEYKEVIDKCLDLSPFPYVGFIKLKESRAKKLWCSDKCENLVKILAEKNCIKLESITFVDESNLLEIADDRFDLIILNVFQELGDLNNEIVSNYQIFQQLLRPKGILIPHKIFLYGSLINSEWLTNCCKITNENIKEMKIDKFINKYSTKVHFDLTKEINSNRLTNDFKVAEILWDETYYEQWTKPFMRNISLPVDFILLFFKIKFTSSCDEFQISRDESCCFKKFTQTIETEKIVDNASPKVKYIQNFGLFKIECE